MQLFLPEVGAVFFKARPIGNTGRELAQYLQPRRFAVGHGMSGVGVQPVLVFVYGGYPGQHGYCALQFFQLCAAQFAGIVEDWRKAAALARRDLDATTALFEDDCFWRDLVSFTWNICTQEGKGPLRAMLESRVIPLGIFSRKSLSEFLDADYIFEKTREGFAFYEKHFAYPYPFEKYDQLFVPEFNAGAMENAGAVTFLEDYVFRSKVTRASYERRAETLLHEMAHMWFGDLVTMRWWDDLWLNESFATFASPSCALIASSTVAARPSCR